MGNGEIYKHWGMTVKINNKKFRKKRFGNTEVQYVECKKISVNARKMILLGVLVTF